MLNGLSHATTLFLMASGLTLIFGVTRIVNFAHGSFFMLGALFSAHALTRWWPVLADSAWGYAWAMLLGAALAALVGALAEFALLRRMRQAPELYQLVATFGLTLALHDAMRWFFGHDEVFAPRFPGLKGAVALGEAYFPTWQLFTLVLGPLVWWGLHALLTRTLWGKATRDTSLRSRSTIITFSARSLGAVRRCSAWAASCSGVAPRGAVPFMGRASKGPSPSGLSSPSCQSKKSSGDTDSTCSGPA